jgi:hypothetical protein
MRKLYYILNTNGLKTVYYADYHLLMKYGIMYWGNTSESNKVFILGGGEIIITIIIITIKIKIIMGVGPTHSCRGLFKQLSILPILCVRLYLFSLDDVCG